MTTASSTATHQASTMAIGSAMTGSSNMAAMMHGGEAGSGGNPQASSQIHHQQQQQHQGHQQQQQQQQVPGGGQQQVISYTAERIIGNGSFGVVFKATVVQTGEIVAIKKVLQDKRFKNRELQIIRKLHHPNIVHLKHCFYSNNERGTDELYLNLVLEFVPETVYGVTRAYNERHERMPAVMLKCFIFQLCRALAFVHAQGICHRDIKPQNLLVDATTCVLKLCDFGSAKQLVPGEPNVSYICSRYYRAPELIFGATDYSCQIDTWSLGCVTAELMLGKPLFPGKDCVEQLVEIFQVLGTPTRQEIEAMNPNYTDFRFTAVQRKPWNRIFATTAAPELVDLVSRTLTYTPRARLPPIHALVHPAFNEIRAMGCLLPNGRPLPAELFNYTETELQIDASIRARLLERM